MTTYLVTGAAGFIGSNLCSALLDRGEQVVGFDNFETGRRSNLHDVQLEPNFAFVDGDLRRKQDVTAVFDEFEPDYVLHQGAVPSVPRSVDDPERSMEANCTGTITLLRSSLEADVEKVIVASSSSVYGSDASLPKRESMPVDPESPYALSKYVTEELAVQFSEFYDLETVALRYFNVFGPRQDPASDYAAVIPKFIRLMLQGDRPTIYGDGNQSRDFTYIENVIKANLKAAQSAVTGEVYNVACGERWTVNELVDELNDVLDTALEPVYESPRPGDVKHSLADIDKARSELGYEPTVGFRTGLERTVRSIERELPAYDSTYSPA